METVSSATGMYIIKSFNVRGVRRFRSEERQQTPKISNILLLAKADEY